MTLYRLQIPFGVFWRRSGINEGEGREEEKQATGGDSKKEGAVATEDLAENLAEKGDNYKSESLRHTRTCKYKL